MVPVYLMIAAALLSMLICYQIARARSANRVFWVVMAAIFGPLAIPFAFFARPVAAVRKANPPNT